MNTHRGFRDLLTTRRPEELEHSHATVHPVLPFGDSDDGLPLHPDSESDANQHDEDPLWNIQLIALFVVGTVGILMVLILVSCLWLSKRTHRNRPRMGLKKTSFMHDIWSNTHVIPFKPSVIYEPPSQESESLTQAEMEEDIGLDLAPCNNANHRCERVGSRMTRSGSERNATQGDNEDHSRYISTIYNIVPPTVSMPNYSRDTHRPSVTSAPPHSGNRRANRPVGCEGHILYRVIQI